MASYSLSISMKKLSFPTSTNLGIIPLWVIIFEVDVYVYGVVITSSPFFMSSTFKTSSMPAVALDTGIEQFVLQYFAVAFSNSASLGPDVIHPDLKTSATALTSASVISGGENGIFFFFKIINPLVYYFLYPVKNPVSFVILIPPDSFILFSKKSIIYFFSSELKFLSVFPGIDSI